jgi:hypothetical protein
MIWKGYLNYKMATSNKDTERSNQATNVLTVKILINGKVINFNAGDIKECYFIEDIFSHCIVGKLTFVDNYGLLEYGPFTGNEIVNIKYGVYNIKEITFHIWKVSNIFPVYNAESTVSPGITLELVDISYESMSSHYYSKSYETKMKHTEVVKQILTNMIGWSNNKVNILESSSELKEPFVIPYWTPSTTIKHLLNRAKYNTNGYGYLCYNNTKNSFSVNVYPLSYLLGSNNVLDETPYKMSDTKEPMKGKVLDWWIEGISHGMTKTFRRSLSYNNNIETKTTTKTILTYDDYLKFETILGNYSLFDTTYGLSDDYVSSINIYSGSDIDVKHKLNNNFSKNYNLSNFVNIIVYGNERRYAGHQIKIEWPSTNREFELLNKMFQGVYLVKTITHNFANTTDSIGYTQRMVLIRNGYSNPSTDILRKAIIKNSTGGKKTSEFKYD